MSYARLGPDSDVYVYPDSGGFVCCFGCLLAGDTSGDDALSTDLHSAEAAAAHMQAHVDAGHKVRADLLDPAAFTNRPFDPFPASE